MQRASPVTAAPRPPGVWAQLPLLCILVQGEGEAPALLCRHASGRVGAGSCPTGISMSGRGDPSRGTSRQRGGLPMLSSSPRRRGVAGMRSRQRMFAAVMRLLLKCLRLGRRRRFKLVRQAEQLWHYGHLCLRSLLYNSFTNSDVVLDSLFEPVYWLVDHVTRWFGVVFVALVIGLTSSIVAIVYICLLPLILQTYTPAWICWHLAYGHWNLIMIVFHYYMAITTSPGHPPQAKDDLTGVSICRKCIAPKPARTHHCSICNRRTTRPRHPPSPSASELSTRAWSTSGSCAARWHWPWVPSRCGMPPSSPVGKPASSGTSTRRRGRGCRRKVFRNPYSYGGWDNWKVFLGVDVPRHWFTRVLLPSPHLPHGTGLSWDLPPCVTKQRAPLLAI
ncbi:palmitoyltransferase ZDHHC16 isoform X7 [Nyctibius grandis]|uniref:palmitoyltransferase ZDHHC16 isoform X7 n=1 Tax=Nyctibius grandis TaxID=48427 RepID=UPI0035BBAF44